MFNNLNILADRENCKLSFGVQYGSIFGKSYLLAIDPIMLALFWSYVPNMK